MRRETEFFLEEIASAIAHDSIGDWGSAINRGSGMAYCGNNPINWRDPFGLDILDEAWKAGEWWYDQMSKVRRLGTSTLRAGCRLASSGAETGAMVGATFWSRFGIIDGNTWFFGKYVKAGNKAGEEIYTNPWVLFPGFSRFSGSYEDYRKGNYLDAGEQALDGFIEIIGLAGAAKVFGGWLKKKFGPSKPARPGPSNRALHEKYKECLREQMSKPAVDDPKLRKILDEMYRENARVGSGSTAAAIRHERATGGTVGGRTHTIKGREKITQLKKWLKQNPKASPKDRSAAENVIKDTQAALDGN